MFFLREKIEIYSEKRYNPRISKTNGAAVLYYIHGPRIDEIISDSRGYCYHSDGLGSIVNLTDSSGNKANSYTYMAFGQMRNQSGTVSNPWLFTGRQYDSESGLYYYRNRYYDPKTGRFITRDPIGIAGGINFYQYCGNNPVNLVDPLGLEPGSRFKGFSRCPRYGNWGGEDWSGGTQIHAGQIGPNIDAVDQMDGYFKQHDTCCYNTLKAPTFSDRKALRVDCDKTLYKQLDSLPENPSTWFPPAKNFREAIKYREKAEWWFGDVLGYRYGD